MIAETKRRKNMTEVKTSSVKEDKEFLDKVENENPEVYANMLELLALVTNRNKYIMIMANSVCENGNGRCEKLIVNYDPAYTISEYLHLAAMIAAALLYGGFLVVDDLVGSRREPDLAVLTGNGDWKLLDVDEEDTFRSFFE